MTQTPRLEQVINDTISDRMTKFWTAVPCRVERYYPQTQRADVRMVVMNPVEDSTGKKLWYFPIARYQAVLFPGGTTSDAKKYRITYPISEGDDALFVVSTFPLEVWNSAGFDESNTDPEMLNHLAWGFVLPGLHAGTTNYTTSPTDAMVLHGDKVKIGGPDGTEPTIKANTFLTSLGGLDDFLTLLKAFVVAAESLPSLSGTATPLAAGIDTLKALLSASKTSNTEVK